MSERVYQVGYVVSVGDDTRDVIVQSCISKERAAEIKAEFSQDQPNWFVRKEKRR